MGNLPFWLGIGAAQKSAGSKELKPSRHPIIAFVVGTLIALAIIAECLLCLFTNNEIALRVEIATLKYSAWKSMAAGGEICLIGSLGPLTGS